MAWKQLKSPTLTPAAIYSGSTKLSSWSGWCLAYVQVAFGTPRLYPTAWAAWQATSRKHTNRTFPKNVYFPVWFSHQATYNGVHQNWGHVAISKVNTNGSMTLWSSPASNKTAPDTYSSIEAVERMYSSTYVGWSEDLSNTQLIQKEDEMTKEDSFKECFITIAKRWPTQAEVNAWKKSGMSAYTWSQQNAPVGYRVERDEARSAFSSYREQAEKEMGELSQAEIKARVALENAERAFKTERAGWEHEKAQLSKDFSSQLSDYQLQIDGMNKEIVDLTEHLKMAQQNAKDVARWTWQEHLSALIQKLFQGR